MLSWVCPISHQTVPHYSRYMLLVEACHDLGDGGEGPTKHSRIGDGIAAIRVGQHDRSRSAIMNWLSILFEDGANATLVRELAKGSNVRIALPMGIAFPISELYVQPLQQTFGHIHIC
jgi:hypothetical protein